MKRFSRAAEAIKRYCTTIFCIIFQDWRLNSKQCTLYFVLKGNCIDTVSIEVSYNQIYCSTYGWNESFVWNRWLRMLMVLYFAYNDKLFFPISRHEVCIHDTCTNTGDSKATLRGNGSLEAKMNTCMNCQRYDTCERQEARHFLPGGVLLYGFSHLFCR